MNLKDYKQAQGDLASLFANSGDAGYGQQSVLAHAAAALQHLLRDLRDCRNELCLKCGDYKMAHKGACDGCRWKDMGD